MLLPPCIRPLRIATPLTLIAASLLAACGLADSGTTYPLQARDVRQTLLATEPPVFVFGGNAESGRGTPAGDGAVRWLLKDAERGRSLFAFVARIEDLGEGQSRVSVAVEPPDGDAKGAIAQRLADNPSIVALYKAAMEEQIDAALEKREFNFAVLQDELAGATIANMPRIVASADEAARANAQRSRANIDRAYREEAQGGWNDGGSSSHTEPAFGEPMDRGVGGY